MDDLRVLIGHNLERAREALKMGQAEAAVKLDIDRQRLIGIEKGSRPVDAAMLVAFSRLYRVELSQLVSEAASPEPLNVLFRNCSTGDLLPAEQDVVERFKAFCGRFARFLRLASRPERQARLIEVDPSASSRTRRYAVEGDAARLRRAWDIGETAPIGTDLFWHLEDQGVTVYLWPVGSGHLAGASLRYPGLGAAMFVNTEDTPQRQAFTAAHELGHLIYHLGDRSTSDCYISKKFDKTAEEQLANDFASAFLMPESGIKRYLSQNGHRDEQLEHVDVIALQRHFRVSYAAMVYRLRKLGIVKGGSSFDHLMEIQPVLEAQRLGYPVQPWEFRYQSQLKRPQGLPELFISLVIKAYEQGDVGREKAAEALEMNSEALQTYLTDLRVDPQVMASEREDAAVSVG